MAYLYLQTALVFAPSVQLFSEKWWMKKNIFLADVKVKSIFQYWKL